MESPADVAGRFLHAVRQRAGADMWAMLSPIARTYVLDLGERIGVPADVIGRMRIDTADEVDRARFLNDVVSGIRADLQGADLDRLEVEVFDHDRDRARVGLVQPIGDGVGPPMPAIPAAWLEMSYSDEGWSIDALVLPD